VPIDAGDETTRHKPELIAINSRSIATEKRRSCRGGSAAGDSIEGIRHRARPTGNNVPAIERVASRKHPIGAVAATIILARASACGASFSAGHRP
jgi:hypothetical protein